LTGVDFNPLRMLERWLDPTKSGGCRERRQAWWSKRSPISASACSRDSAAAIAAGGFGSFLVALFVTPILLVLLLTGRSRRVEWYFAKTLSAVAVEAAVLRIRWGSAPFEV
jgi:hypothetical protein